MFSAMSDTASFVQFPHPGNEHRPRGDHMPWNTGTQGRKFLLTPGRYLADQDQRQAGEVMFWGEWEPPSRVQQHWPTEGDLPRTLHRPYWTRPPSLQPRQNTDPWVFGEHMLYSNCKQTTGTPPRPTGMQTLEPGSVICFGSTLHGEFCVDIVFVVATAQPWTPDQATDLNVDEAFDVCTAHALTASADTGCARRKTDCTPDAGQELTLYRGATLDNPIHDMYSFVPARPADHPHPRFARPAVHLPTLINPASTQSPRGARPPQPIEVVRQAWVSLRDQILTHDLVLATSLTTPPCAPATEPIPATVDAHR